MAKLLYYEDVKVGMEIPKLVVLSNILSQVKWAGVNRDYDPEHYDREHALSLGLTAPIVNGVFKLVSFARLLMNWTGDAGNIRKLDCRYIGMDIVGDLMTFKGIVKQCAMNGAEKVVECQVWVENINGEKTTLGIALIDLPSRH